MKEAVQGNSQKLIQTFYSIGRQSSAAQKFGRKRNLELIPVQTTAISWRVAKHCSRGKAPAGRKPKEQRKRTQFIIMNDTALMTVTL